MKKLLLLALAMLSLHGFAQDRHRVELRDWTFYPDARVDAAGRIVRAADTLSLATESRPVRIPHDWAITGSFSRENDLQHVAVLQNGETTGSLKTGRTGGLPYVGCGVYETTCGAGRADSAYTLIFDGAMAEAEVYINGRKAYEWPYGYNSFHFDATPFLRNDGGVNRIVVALQNRPQSSRWYPGAGLFRGVRLETSAARHIATWGVHVTTPHVEKDFATVAARTEVVFAHEGDLSLSTFVVDPHGKVVARRFQSVAAADTALVTTFLEVPEPELWSPETPSLYVLGSEVWRGNECLDRTLTPFGVRTVEVVPQRGFYLNGTNRKFRGVCLHHDLGPLGAAVNISALRHQLELLKEMGCDAIRTTHNMPAPELVELCDEMGFMMMLEPFDEWDLAKCENGYHRYFDLWAEKDMVNMLRHYRNHPSVVIWSIGNEVPTQCAESGREVAQFLYDIVKREDPTRPVTCGMDQVTCVLDNGFAAVVDVPGFNYRAHRYEEAYSRLPQGVILRSETTSTVSSRGIYKFPVEQKADALYPDHQSSGYDVEFCSWSNIPDADMANADDYPWTMGQFVWTGFDYLGEPSPYDTDAWPSHSSLFGIFDLASLPKDRYWFYRAQWRKDSPTLHLLPHWQPLADGGKVRPVYVYTSFPEAEVFVNGKSQGRRRFQTAAEAADVKARYRLMWPDVVYEPGEVRVVAYDAEGNAAAEEVVKTAGAAHHLVVEKASLSEPRATGDDLIYFTIRAVDKNGTFVPTDTRLVQIRVDGAGTFEAMANGDAACIEPFQRPSMHLFSGALTAIVRAGETAGDIRITASAKGLKSGEAVVTTRP